MRASPPGTAPAGVRTGGGRKAELSYPAVERKTRIKLIVAGVVGAVLFVGGLAWHESGFPLRYLRPDRVRLARARCVQTGRSRNLEPEELSELCDLLRSARKTDPFQARRSVGVELITADYGRVMVYDLDGPGANLHLNAGKPQETTCTVRSSKLGRFLAGLAEELGAPEPGEGGGGS